MKTSAKLFVLFVVLSALTYAQETSHEESSARHLRANAVRNLQQADPQSSESDPPADNSQSTQSEDQPNTAPPVSLGRVQQSVEQNDPGNEPQQLILVQGSGPSSSQGQQPTAPADNNDQASAKSSTETSVDQSPFLITRPNARAQGDGSQDQGSTDSNSGPSADQQSEPAAEPSN